MFGIDLIDASFLPAALVALVAGLLSFLSPCVLPIVPPYLAYMGGVSMGELREGRRAAVVPALFFVMGLSTVFLLMGVAASAMGQFFLANQEWFGRLSGVVIIALGLHFLGVYRIALLDREARLDAGDRGGSSLGAYVLGLAFAFGWTPCIGPQLGAILSIAAQGGSMGKGVALLAVYAAGLGIPFLLAALFISRAMGVMNRIKRHMGLIEKAMGGLLVLVGVLLLTNAFSALSFWLLETFPGLARLG